jgi:HSP20 family protein
MAHDGESMMTMTTRTVWHPLHDVVSLRDAMDRLVADSFISPGALLDTVGATMAVAANLYETADEYIAQFSLPGVDPDKMQITVQGDTISLKGERTTQSFEHAQQIWNGIGQSHVEQAFSLPVAVDAQGAQATSAWGVLTLRLPKAQHARAHTIKVDAGSSQEPPVLRPPDPK